MSSLPTLHTERLILRPFGPSDAAAIQALAGAIEVYRMTLNVPHPYEDGMAEQWIATHPEVFEKNHRANLAVVHKPTNRLIGSISLSLTPSHRRGELGYWIGVPHWGRGYASEAVQALVRYGFDTLGLHKITGRHVAMNPASGRVMQKAGLVKEGILRDEIVKDGRFHDLVVYGCVVTDALFDRH